MLSVLRIVAGFVFMTVGTMKLFDVPESGMTGFPVHLWSELGAAASLETFGGLAILLGLFTRPIAFVCAGEMAVAYFQVHFPRGFFPPVNGGMPAVLFCFLYLYLSFAGGGSWSVDAWLRSRREDRTVRGR
jgi:putative oxidoreductase